jgi:hypothetical protein
LKDHEERCDYSDGAGSEQEATLTHLLRHILVLPLVATSVAAEVTKEDAQRLVAAGIPDSVILSFLRAHGPIERISACDPVELKEAGAGERILQALVEGSSKERQSLSGD